MKAMTILVGSSAAVLTIAACGGGAASTTSAGRHSTTGHHSARRSRAAAVPKHRTPPSARVLVSAQGSTPTDFVPVAVWRGQTAGWIARSSSGVALLSFNQRLLELKLHSGTLDAGATGWRYGPLIKGSERRHLLAAFNGGFKLDTGAGGFMSYGRTAASVRDGLGSIVTYTDGYTDIGSWRRELPSSGPRVASVRQNLTLLIDHGQGAASADCVSCWGATLGGVSDPARSALGITQDGHLIWAGAEHATVTQLAHALLSARVIRAVELDINPEWVAGYLYRHPEHPMPLTVVPVVPGQPGVPGQFLTPYSRDFFTVLTR